MKVFPGKNFWPQNLLDPGGIIFTLRKMRYINTFFLLLLLSSLTGCTGKCTYKVFAETKNPKNSYRVVKFYNWCGYTSSNNINFSLLSAADSIENRGRMIFVAGSLVGENLDRDTTVNVTWKSDTSILITYDHTLRIIQKKSRLDDIEIEYAVK